MHPDLQSSASWEHPFPTLLLRHGGVWFFFFLITIPFYGSNQTSTKSLTSLWNYFKLGTLNFFFSWVGSKRAMGNQLKRKCQLLGKHFRMRCVGVTNWGGHHCHCTGNTVWLIAHSLELGFIYDVTDFPCPCPANWDLWYKRLLCRFLCALTQMQSYLSRAVSVGTLMEVLGRSGQQLALAWAPLTSL